MQLILTHENADFDAVASQLAAHKLYPESVPLLSQRINRNVAQFLSLYWDKFPFMRRADWRKRRIDQILLVDTQSFNRVRGIITKPDVRVIDHHEKHSQRPFWQYELDNVGATVTMLVERLQMAGISLTVEEATLLQLGIYEDSGSLSYDTTTVRDIRAAAWLLEQGAHLPVVRRYINIPLTPAQRDLYQQLEANATWSQLGGQAIVVATAERPNDFEDELSSIAHRLRDALDPTALFLLVQMSDDVQLVARSNSEYVDVSYVAKAFGGGGHSRAAAALIPKNNIHQIHEQLLALLPAAVQYRITVVSQMMSYGVQTVAPHTTIAAAAKMMQRFGYEGYPVFDHNKQQLVGLLTRRAVDRAVNHQMAHLPVNRIMKAGAVTVQPTESIERVQQLMLAEGWGQIPVTNGQDGTLLGIVTRTDVLNALSPPTTETAVPDLKQLLQTHLSPTLWQMVLAISQVADRTNLPLYFVGGLVRDLLLQKAPVDLDMVVEGDAITLARQLCQQYGGEVRVHHRFGTAKWLVTPTVWQIIAPDLPHDTAPTSIDFITARTEFYTEPSALPEVAYGSIKLDLHRRDFTINTLAVRLDGAYLGQLLDFYGGYRDLQQGIIRVLHSLSFIDDPTRILRAVRFEQRLDFTIAPRTAELIDNALPILDRITGARIRHELELAFCEQNPIPIMLRLSELGVWQQLHPNLTWSPQTAVWFSHVPTYLTDTLWQTAQRDETPAFLYFALWMLSMTSAVQTFLMQRLKTRKTTQKDIEATQTLLSQLDALPATAKPSEVAAKLRPYEPRVLLLARIIINDKSPQLDYLDNYYATWRHIKTAVTGNDLRQMGLTPGPQFSIWLNHLLAARLDGEVVDEAGERQLLQTWLTTNAQPKTSHE